MQQQRSWCWFGNARYYKDQLLWLLVTRLRHAKCIWAASFLWDFPKRLPTKFWPACLPQRANLNDAASLTRYLADGVAGNGSRGRAGKVFPEPFMSANTHHMEVERVIFFRRTYKNRGQCRVFK